MPTTANSYYLTCRNFQVTDTTRTGTSYLVILMFCPKLFRLLKKMWPDAYICT